MNLSVTVSYECTGSPRAAAMGALDLKLPEGWRMKDLSVYERGELAPVVVAGAEAPPPPPVAEPEPAPKPATRRRAKPSEEPEASAPAEPPPAIHPDDNPETGADPEAPAEDVPDMDDMRAAASKLVNSGNGGKLKAILLDVGASSLSDVSEADRAALLKRILAAAKG